MKKLTVAIVAVTMMTAMSANAGWFKTRSEYRESKQKALQPSMGYTEKTEEVTGDFGDCVTRWKQGAQMSQKDGTYYVTLAGFGATNNCISFNTISYNSVYTHECPECTKGHIKDYPKTKVVPTGKQKKHTTTIYKDGKVVSIITEYAYPHEKSTKSVTTSIKYVESVETVIEATKEPTQ